MKETKQIIQELGELISYATISSNEKYKPAIIKCAEWLKEHFYSIGMQKATIYATSHHPVVYAEHINHSSLPTILFYGHYDVQPVDPVEKWKTPPFKATIVGNHICGRGSSDDKGQFFIHIKAVERLLQKNKRLPVNIKFLIEGSEEIGSAGLKGFIQDHKNLLRCDVAVVSDTKMASLSIPAITYSLRGSLNAEINIHTLEKELHSGTFGGCVSNAAVVAGKLIATLFNRDNSIAIPGFYDDVENVSSDERAFISANGKSDEDLLKDAEIIFDWGEKNYTMHERTTIRPSLCVTSITSGFQGVGVKNVIPSAASVKINFRLVKNQKPERVKQLLNNFIAREFGKDNKIQIKYSSFANPVIVSKNNPFVIAAVKAYEAVFNQKVKLIRSGGTIGAVDYLNSILKIPVVLMGFAQVSDNMHAPNEKFYLPNFFRGIGTVMHFIQNVAKKYSHALSAYQVSRF